VQLLRIDIVHCDTAQAAIRYQTEIAASTISVVTVPNEVKLLEFVVYFSSRFFQTEDQKVLNFQQRYSQFFCECVFKDL